jgi:ABC-2 type transport system permease protein
MSSTPDRATPSGAFTVLPPRVSGSQRAVTALPDPPLLHLLTPKWITARARTLQGRKGRTARFAVLGFVGVLFWAFVYVVLYRLLTYFRGVEEIGLLLAGKLLGLLMLGFTSILLLSNVITALSSFFLAKDLDMLVAGPVDWLRLYGAKLLETVIASSWMVLLVSIPLFTAYGVAYDGGFAFPLVVIATMLPLFIIPAVVGSAVTLLLVNVFPAHRTRDILSVIAVLTAGGIVLLFRLIRPERLARPEGFRSLIDFIAVLRTPSSPLLPSEWASNATMGYLQGTPDWLSLYLLWTTALASVVLGALLHRTLYMTGFSKAQESAQKFIAGGGALARFGRRLLSPFGILRRELVMKELRLFFRDTTQWSQLILLGVLVVVYVFNIKYLPLRG